MPANVTTRVDTRANGGQRVEVPSGDSVVSVRERETNQVSDAQPVQRADVAQNASGRQDVQAVPGNNNDAYLTQAVSRDFSSLAKPQEQERVGSREQQRIAVSPTIAQASGMAQARQQQQPQSRGIPVVNASDVQNMPVMSSRSATDFSQSTQNAVQGGAALLEARMEGGEARLNKYGQVTDSVPSARAMSTMETARVNARERSDNTSRETVEARSQQSAAQTTGTSTAQKVAEGKPDSIFNRSFGYNGKSREPRTRQAPMKRAASIVKAAQDRAARAFKRSNVGVRVYGKMLGLAHLGLRDIGIGVQEIVAVANQNTDMLSRLLNTDVAMMSTTELVQFINNNEIYVGTFKEPSNRGPDVQRRRLRILTDHQRGIYLHPIMAAMYTADFDGDDMEVSFDPGVAKLAKDPMAHMIDVDGKQTLNTDFLSVAELVDGYSKGRSARDFVREVILEFIANMDGRTARPLVDAILQLGKTADKGGDAQAAAWGDLFRTARQVSDILNPNNTANSDRMMERIVRSVQQTMRDIAYQNVLTTIDADIVATEALPTPRTYDDSAVFRIIDDSMQNGSVPNNFQDLKILLSGFLGNVKGKNAPFRFSADVGKMMKMDPRLQVGSEFVVDPSNDEQMQMFFESTVKFMQSRRMAREIKTAGRSHYYTQLMRDKVIGEVGFPETYENYSDFLNAFVASYNRNSAIINEANLVFTTNMGIASDSNRGLVSPLNPSPGGVTLGDIAEPMLSIYGTYSVGRMFWNLSTSGVMGDHVDQRWKGTPGHITKLRKRGSDASKSYEREYEYSDTEFWVSGKYLSYNLRQFKNENRLTRGSSDYSSMKVSNLFDDNISTEFYMLMAIADKRTSAASKFNKSVYGAMEGNHVSGEGTTVQMMADLLTELYRLDTQGEVIQPGYYAGIGSRETPLEVQKSMANVASKLSNLGWIMRSGHAGGADQAFERGAGKNAMIYLPTSGWNGAALSGGHLVDFDSMSIEDRRAAEDSVIKYHPAGKNLDKNKFAFKAHRRNYFQVIGTNGAPDSAFVACWTPVNDDKSHGTDQAIRIARSRGIPVFNAAEYDDLSKWEEDVIAAAMKAKAGELSKTSYRDQMLYVDDVIQTLAMSGPDMFYHFNMDNTAGFLQSKWAQKMMEHRNDPEVLGGIRTAMVFDYRMERIMSLTADVVTADQDVEQWVHDISNLQLAKDELASASEVWRGIFKEFEAEATSGMDSVFSILANGSKPGYADANTGEFYAWDIKYEAHDFWRNPGEHTSLRSVIEDLDLDRETKWNVITDVVRYWENDAYLKSYEVGYQLEIGNDSSYDLNSGASQSALGTHKDFEQSFNRWGKLCQKELQDDVDNAYKNHGDKPDRLMRTLRRLDYSPWELVEIDDMMYADSILSVMDKSYAQTEKASQHPWTNAIYAALSFQRNGGYMNDITRTNDRLLGVQNVNSIGIADIIHLLADPDAMIEAYNDYGERGILTRESLLTNALGRELSQNIESDIWEFLRQEPRIASAIRNHSACVSTDTKGKGYLGAKLSFDETINNANSAAFNPVNHVRYLMRDHPTYAAIISLVTPMQGKVTRNHRQRIANVESYLSSRLYWLASDRDMDSSQAATEIMGDLGITQEALRDALRSDYDKFLEVQGLAPSDSGESDEDADLTYYQIASSLARYINEVRQNVQLGYRFAQVAPKPDGIGIDAASMASFWDVVQELSGAKTSVSTGIEGYETWMYAEWASHISSKDKYADLEAVPDGDIDASWNGMWTNLRNPDGSPMLLQVGEDGSVVNYDALMQAKSDQGFNEIITMVPEDYTVKDRSTDSHGTPVSSLFAYMVSKRSNGAEAFNLKAKKSGIDGKDSITKMNGKYRMVSYEGQERRASLMEMEHRLRQLAQQSGENGLMVAKSELALQLLQANSELGYDDMTISNYMNIADMMLIEGDDGQIYLRSLEMLFSAIKYRLGPAVDEMTDAEIREAADAIVNDTSETGVGIAQMASPLEVLDGIRPKSKSVSVNGIRQNSSVFERNYDLLSKITEDASVDGINPISPDKAKQLTNRYSNLAGVKDVTNDMSAVRNYSIVGHAGAFADEQINWTVGPSNAIVIGNGKISDTRVIEICYRAYQLGMTVIIGAKNRNKIPSSMIKGAMPCSDRGDVIVPCFDMRLNGSESTPYNGGRFAIFQAPYSRYVASVEDSTNEFGLGDAEAKPVKSFTDRIHVIDNGSKPIRAEDLFPNVFRNPDFRHSFTTISLASGPEVARYIVNGVRCTIDYGIVEGGRGFEQRKHDVDAAIERYQQRWSEADPDGIIRGGMTECAPGDIVGWAECEIRDQFTDEVQYVLAPIIPFQLHGPTKGIPEKFSIEQLGTVDDDNTLFAVDWTNTTDISNSFAKYFDSSGGANKGMMDFSDSIEDQRLLRDGTPVDVYIAKASTDSRKIGTDRRIKTMISLMALARMHGYNFAKSDGAFPDKPDLRERMLSERITTSEWRGMLHGDQQFTFTMDAKLNAFLNYECRKILKDGGNPSDYLANVYTDANGVEHNTHVMWEFEAMFDQGLRYEDSLLHFLHTMDPTFCPDGIDDMGDYLFRLYRDGNGSVAGYDNGVLQMQVPHRMANDSISYLWDNVYIGMSFFGEDYSGFSRPNIDGASNFLDAMNTMSYYGARLDESSARFRAMWASADLGRLPRNGGAIGKA